jgi:hypothetical protein
VVVYNLNSVVHLHYGLHHLLQLLAQALSVCMYNTYLCMYVWTVIGQLLAPQNLAMGQTYEQLDKGEQGRLGKRGEEAVPIRPDTQ